MSKDIDNIKYYQKKLNRLNDLRTKHIFMLTHGKPMVHGMPLEVYRKCGKPNCRCSEGHPHGPYDALSINRAGRQKIVIVKQIKRKEVMKEARRYKHFQQTLATIRKINKEIDLTLEELKSDLTKDYIPKKSRLKNP